MAYAAACTDKGARRKTNQDACCIQVANTAFGEVVLAVVCDGVGGLAGGELASGSVVYRFVQWFNDELPAHIRSMGPRGVFDFDMVEVEWNALLANLNDAILAYGQTRNMRLGTTFTGVLICGGYYVVGHVGDCRMYHIMPDGVRQVTEDQTLLAKKLAEGELTPEEAPSFRQGHVILQSVGTEALLRPVFYQGTCEPDDLFVLCCDGAYTRAEDVGIATFFEQVDHRDEDALAQACRNVLQFDLDHGEKDNLTVACVSCDLVVREGFATQGRDMRSMLPDEVEDPTLIDADEVEEELSTPTHPSVLENADMAEMSDSGNVDCPVPEKGC